MGYPYAKSINQSIMVFLNLNVTGHPEFGEFLFACVFVKFSHPTVEAIRKQISVLIHLKIYINKFIFSKNITIEESLLVTGKSLSNKSQE